MNTNKVTIVSNMTAE